MWFRKLNLYLIYLLNTRTLQGLSRSSQVIQLLWLTLVPSLWKRKIFKNVSNYPHKEYSPVVQSSLENKPTFNILHFEYIFLIMTDFNALNLQCGYNLTLQNSRIYQANGCHWFKYFPNEPVCSLLCRLLLPYFSKWTIII